MSVHINLSQHATELKSAYKSVIDKDSSVNWILLGYAKGTNDLKVVGSGEGGLIELSEEFEDDKVLFAFTRVVDPNSNLPKYVFISWCGEGAPVQRKGLLPSHLNDVQKFLSGYHVQINARDSEDVSPEHIMKKIEEGSGAKYSYHDQIRSKPPVAPVPQPTPKATTPPSLPEYKRSVQNLPSREKASTPPVSSFKSPPASQSIQDRFIRQVEQSDKEKTDREKQEQFEKDFLARSNKSNKNGGYQPSSRIQNAREREEQELRERMERARLNRIQNPTENHRQAEEAEAKKAEQSRQAEADRQNMKYEREQRELAEREEKRKEDLLKEQERVNAEKLRQEQEELERRQQETRDSERSQQQEADSIEKERLQQEEADKILKEKLKQEEADRIHKEKLKQEEAVRIQKEKLQQEEAERQEKERQEKERRQQEETAARLAQEKLQQERLREQEAQLARENQEQEDREREELVLLQAQEAEQLKYSTDPVQETGSPAVLTAIALFDYAAADETEVSLKEGEMVVNIVQIDEGWWQGVNESGQEGIFPANYVELVDNPPPSQDQEASAPPAEETASTTSYAIALYDYQATEEGELNFAAADKITNIEFLSDDWWQGANPLGEQGLFPANYVELQQ